jgi:hypothetical protein
VNGDGFGDLIVGTPGDDTNFVDSGSATVFSGKDGSIVCTERGEKAGARLGTSVSDAGDVDHDGVDDFIVGAPYVCWSGTDTGYAKVLYFASYGCAALYIATGDSAGDALGTAVSTAGDLNHDGFDDFAVGAPCDDNPATDAGSVLLFSGRVCKASWTNYGDGFPGTNCIPSLTASGNPVICETITLDITNCLGQDTPAIVLVGLAPASIPNPSGGTVLVAPPWVFKPFMLPAAGISLPLPVICDTAFCGLAVYMQALEYDPGAPGPNHDVSSTKGLTLVLGGF